MKNKEWLKEQLSYLQDGVGESFNDYSKGLNAAYNTLELLINQLEEPEQEKVVIPQFLGDYIEIAKQDINLIRVFDIANNYEELDRWKKEYRWIRSHYEVFARAWLDGYEVEKQPKYLVKVNDQSSWLYLKSMSLYKDVERRTDLNSNFGGWKEKAIKFSNKEQAESIAKFFGGEIEEITK